MYKITGSFGRKFNL